MKYFFFKLEKEASQAAAKRAAQILKKAVRTRGKATFVAATGKSQIYFLNYLTKDQAIDWAKITMFYLDEYLGLPERHPASFRFFLKKNFLRKVQPGKVYLINGNAVDPEEECHRLSKLISKEKIDVTFLGIGENGHLAFNEPPADFSAKELYRVVRLSKETKRQQVKEGWFKESSAVPKKAISMSIKQILKSSQVICLAFGKRKEKVVEKCFTGKIIPDCPASVLRKHPSVFIYLDWKAAAKIMKKKNVLAQIAKEKKEIIVTKRFKGIGNL